MIFHLRRLVLPMVALLATASIAIAQAPASARVRVLSAEGAPVSGALVALLHGGGSIAAEGLSTAIRGRAGDYLALPNGRTVHPQDIARDSYRAAPWIKQLQVVLQAADRFEPYPGLSSISRPVGCTGVPSAPS